MSQAEITWTLVQVLVGVGVVSLATLIWAAAGNAGPRNPSLSCPTSVGKAGGRAPTVGLLAPARPRSS